MGLVWRTGDQFASDLLRDIAVVQVLLTESPRVLLDAGVPRWGLHATRVAFQAFMLSAGDGAPWNLSEQLSFCKELAAKDGERWADLPWEAALTVTEPALLLEREWILLSAQGGKGLQDVMRVLKIRFGDSFKTDRYVGASVVSLLCDYQRELGSFDYDVVEGCDETILRWLRGLASEPAKDVPNILRAKVRDQFILSPQQKYWNEWYVESLGLLGPDLDGAASERLRSVAKARPDKLHACLENLIAPLSLSVHRPQLLLELAEAYYIKTQNEREHSWSGSRHSGDYGVRDHRGVLRSAWIHAAWYYGPFFSLLRAPSVCDKAIDFLNRLLDRAAYVRVDKRNEPSSFRFTDEAKVESGIDIDLPGIGMRRFVGDSHVWRWYRGTSVGPYPCMSALMALEVAVDEWIRAGVAIPTITHCLLKNAESLAMAGFVYGILVRHIDEAGELLEPWLAIPEIWRLELRRTMDEQVGRRWAEADKVDHPERRTWDAMTVANFLVVQAITGESSSAIARLSAIGDRLVENARQRYECETLADTKAEARFDSSLSKGAFYSRIRVPSRGPGRVTASHSLRARGKDGSERSRRQEDSCLEDADALDGNGKIAGRSFCSRIRLRRHAIISGNDRTRMQCRTNKASITGSWNRDNVRLVGKEVSGVSHEQTESEDVEDVLVFRRWAGALAASNYQFVESEQGVEIQYIPPRDVVEKLKKRSDDHMRGQRLYEIQVRYGLPVGRGKAKLSR